MVGMLIKINFTFKKFNFDVKKKSVKIYKSCADPESFFSGGPTLTFF